MTAACTHVVDPVEEAEPPADGVLSRTIFRDDRIEAVVFGFAQGEEHSEQAAVLFLVEGEAAVDSGDDAQESQAGTRVHTPAGLKHCTEAKTPVVVPPVLLN